MCRCPAPERTRKPFRCRAPGPERGLVDIGQVLADLASNKGRSLAYERSIVDLLKRLDPDGNLQARKQLADELHDTGDKAASATRIVWPHKQLVRTLAENGGNVPDDLKQA